MIEGGFPEVTDADIAYMRDDFTAATGLFIENIENEPDQFQHWAGLALSSQDPRISGVLMAAPEVLYAVYHETLRRDATPPDLIAIATWLAPITATVRSVDH